MSKVQVDFFAKIKDHIPEFENLAQCVADALQISQNEAYKKIKGLSQLSISQIETLSNVFKVPFFYAGSTDRTVSFTYAKIGDLSEYLDSLNRDLNLIKQAKKKSLTVITDDIPVFYLFKYAELAAFKLQFWQSAVTDDTPPFTFNAIDKNLLEKCIGLNQIYLQIPTVEIWGKNAVDYTIEQIRYTWEAGILTDVDFLVTIVTQLKACIQDISAYAVSGRKSIDEAHTFDWYSCDVIGSMSFIADVNSKLTCYNRFSAFNVLKTDDANYCQVMNDWSKRLIKKSTCFSKQSEKYRNKYLLRGVEKCADLLKEIDNSRS
jgi:hypothetical protein